MPQDIVIGIDIGGTYTKFGSVDRMGNSYMEGSVETAGHPDVDSFLASLFAAIHASQKKTGLELNIRGIGIGAPNGNYYNGTIEYAPNLSWKEVVPLAALVKKILDVPVVLTNDANAAAIGEMMYGGARNMKDFIVITLGTGLGSGIVINGKVVYGHDGFAGELGHVVAVDNGRQCGCGKKGCLEAYASATGIKRTVFQLLSECFEPSTLRDISFSRMTSKDIADAAGRGDKIALKAFELTGRVLGRNLANAVAFSSPEAIFLFGGLARAGELITGPTREHMEKNLLKIYRNKVKLLPSELEDKNAAVLGAAGLIWNELPG